MDLRVEKGEIFGFLGPNGAGKTTTLRMLATLLVPDGRGGHAWPASTCARQPGEVRQRIGYVAQGGTSGTRQTGRGELVIQARLYGVGKAEAMRRATAVLELVRARPRPPTARPARYSGGQRRRLDVALGIIHGRRCCSWTSRPPAWTRRRARHMWDEVRRLRDDGHDASS